MYSAPLNSTSRPPTSLLPRAHRRHDLADGNVVRLQLVRIHVDLVLPHESAQWRDFGNAGNRLQLVAKDTSPDSCAARPGSASRVSIRAYSNTHPMPVASGPSSVLTPWGSSRQDVREVFQRAGAGPINVRAFIEDDVDVGVAEVGKPAHVLHRDRGDGRLRPGGVVHPPGPCHRHRRGPPGRARYHREPLRRPVQRGHPARRVAAFVPLAQRPGRDGRRHRRARRRRPHPARTGGIRLRLRHPPRPPGD